LFAVVGAVDAGVEEVPLAVVWDEGTRGIDAIRVGLLLVPAFRKIASQ
jgi:hypothetical protein